MLKYQFKDHIDQREEYTLDEDIDVAPKELGFLLCIDITNFVVVKALLLGLNVNLIRTQASNGCQPIQHPEEPRETSASYLLYFGELHIVMI